MSREQAREIVRRAAADAGYRALLLSDPESALADYDLSDEERAALTSSVAETLAGTQPPPVGERQSGEVGVTFFPGTIKNPTKSSGGEQPVTFGDDVRIDGAVWREPGEGESSAGRSSLWLLIVLAIGSMVVIGLLAVGGWLLYQIIAAADQTGDSDSKVGFPPFSSSDYCGNGVVDEGEECEPAVCNILEGFAIEDTPLCDSPYWDCTEVLEGVQRCRLNTNCAVGAGAVCDPSSCECVYGCPEGARGCTPYDECPEDSDRCTSYVECQAESGPGYLCDNQTCNCYFDPCIIYHCPSEPVEPSEPGERMDVESSVPGEPIDLDERESLPPALEPGPGLGCGDGVCSSGETCETCPADCGACALPGADGALCGDGICQPGESGEWCGDCPSPEGGSEPEGAVQPPEEGGAGEVDTEPEPEPPPAPQPVCGDGVWEPELGEACEGPGTTCYDSAGAAGVCQPDCTCGGLY